MNIDKLLLKKEKAELLEDIAISMRMQALRESDKEKIVEILQKAIVREADSATMLRTVPLLYESIRETVRNKRK